ncbi:hypothetical protein [Spirosoma sordidisoli]|uniref:Uncharacterized protein n=1 Tax=Spirosoma sordidisoli TaxID=2502893 RepID=A0A4V1RWL3_9BACT|nr:hypothetical protein [Spirosoma sordidisoli]RYC70668.1 hypothetical protein EQG79_00520 [Spirosoma sordidisoli]
MSDFITPAQQQAAFLADAGITPAEQETVLDTPSLSDADKTALQKVAAQPVTGPSVSTETPETPEYLTLPDKTELQAPDWAALYKEQFGEQSVKEGEVIDAEKFYADLTAASHVEHMLANTPGYRDYREFLSRQYDNDDTRLADDKLLVEANVRNMLGRGFTERGFDQKMAEYVEDDVLNEDGKRYAATLRSDAKQWLESVEEQARQKAREAADKTASDRKELREFIAGYKPFGHDYEAEDATFVQDFILNGELDKALENLSKEDMTLIATVLNPHLRTKYFAKLHYDLGAEKGGKARLAKALTRN